MIRPGKTGHICTSTGFHFLSVRESYTHALPRNTRYLTIDGQVCFHRQLFTDAVKPRGCISQPCLRGINRTAWGTRLLLTAVLAHPVYCTSSGPILKTQHCCLSPNGCFSPPSVSHPPPPPPPTRLPPIDSIHDITGSENIYL